MQIILHWPGYVSNNSFYMHAQLLSHVQLFETLWTVACQAPLSMEFSRQEYWSGLPCPPPIFMTVKLYFLFDILCEAFLLLYISEQKYISV